MPGLPKEISQYAPHFTNKIRFLEHEQFKHLPEATRYSPSGVTLILEVEVSNLKSCTKSTLCK